MKLITIIGNYGKGEHPCNGQSIKTSIITEELINIYGENNVKKIDTSTPLCFLLKAIFLMASSIASSKNIIILPAQNGIIIILPLVVIINKLFKRKIHYVVIGGWLCEFLAKHKYLIYYLKKINVVYTETTSLKIGLQKFGVSNIRVMPNFKTLTILKETDFNYDTIIPLRLCTFSRVTRTKGIEDAVKAVIKCNEYFGKSTVTLDIYGKIEDKVWFNTLQNIFPPYIKYKGVVDYNESVETLRGYNALLFPTFYPGEGFAGTIIDALCAGLPIIASDWHDNKFIIHDNETGLIFKTHDIESLTNILIDVCVNPSKLVNMKIACINDAKNYLPANIITIINKEIQK